MRVHKEILPMPLRKTSCMEMYVWLFARWQNQSRNCFLLVVIPEYKCLLRSRCLFHYIENLFSIEVSFSTLIGFVFVQLVFSWNHDMESYHFTSGTSAIIVGHFQWKQGNFCPYISKIYVAYKTGVMWNNAKVGLWLKKHDCLLNLYSKHRYSKSNVTKSYCFVLI